MKTNSTTRVAVITGGAYGIGRAIVRHFAWQGDAVVIGDLHAERGRTLEAELRAEGAQARFCETDVRKPESAQALITFAEEIFGRIDVLCNNAGIEQYARADAYSPEDFDRIMEINLRGQFLCSKFVFPALAKTRGSIINISSVQAMANEAHISVYAAGKAGTLGLTRGMAVDFAPSGVRVNAVCPGAIGETGMMEKALQSAPDPGEMVRQADAHIPLGRMGTPEEIASVVYFLASETAAYITGTSIVVDGGLLARLAV